jgi:hypothetical protein
MSEKMERDNGKTGGWVTHVSTTFPDLHASQSHSHSHVATHDQPVCLGVELSVGLITTY